MNRICIYDAVYSLQNLTLKKFIKLIMFFSCFNISFRTVRDFALSLQGIRRERVFFYFSPPLTTIHTLSSPAIPNRMYRKWTCAAFH